MSPNTDIALSEKRECLNIGASIAIAIENFAAGLASSFYEKKHASLAAYSTLHAEFVTFASINAGLIISVLNNSSIFSKPAASLAAFITAVTSPVRFLISKRQITAVPGSSSVFSELAASLTAPTITITASSDVAGPVSPLERRRPAAFSKLGATLSAFSTSSTGPASHLARKRGRFKRKR